MGRMGGRVVEQTVSNGVGGMRVSGEGREGGKECSVFVTNSPAGRNSQPYQDRRVCAGNTNCIPICPIQAKYDPSVTLAQALRSGRDDVMYKTIASQVLLDKDGRDIGIDYFGYDTEHRPATQYDLAPEY